MFTSTICKSVPPQDVGRRRLYRKRGSASPGAIEIDTDGSLRRNIWYFYFHIGPGLSYDSYGGLHGDSTIDFRRRFRSIQNKGLTILNGFNVPADQSANMFVCRSNN